MLIEFVLDYLDMLRWNCYGALFSDENRYNYLPGICIYCCIVFWMFRKTIRALLQLSQCLLSVVHVSLKKFLTICLISALWTKRTFLSGVDLLFLRLSTLVCSLIEWVFVKSAWHIFASFGMLVYPIFESNHIWVNKFFADDIFVPLYYHCRSFSLATLRTADDCMSGVNSWRKKVCTNYLRKAAKEMKLSGLSVEGLGQRSILSRYAAKTVCGLQNHLLSSVIASW